MADLAALWKRDTLVQLLTKEQDIGDLNVKYRGMGSKRDFSRMMREIDIEGLEETFERMQVTRAVDKYMNLIYNREYTEWERGEALYNLLMPKHREGKMSIPEIVM